MGKPRAKWNPAFLDQIVSHVAEVTRSANTSYVQLSNMHTHLISKQCEAVPTWDANDNNDQCPSKAAHNIYSVSNLVPEQRFRNPLQHVN